MQHNDHHSDHHSHILSPSYVSRPFYLPCLFLLGQLKLIQPKLLSRKAKYRTKQNVFIESKRNKFGLDEAREARLHLNSLLNNNQYNGNPIESMKTILK